MSSWQGVISVNKAKWWVELFVGPKAYRINSIFIHHQSDDMHYVIHTNPFWARSATLASANIGDSLPNWKRLSCHHTRLVLVDKFKCSMYVCHLIIHIFVQYVLMLNKNDKWSGFRRICLQPPPHFTSRVASKYVWKLAWRLTSGPAPPQCWDEWTRALSIQTARAYNQALVHTLIHRATPLTPNINVIFLLGSFLRMDEKNQTPRAGTALRNHNIEIRGR
jgi:hypothetical protein